MIISVEGIDGVGKTTLCKKLAEKLGFVYLDMDKQLVAPEAYYYHGIQTTPNINRGDWRISAYAINLFSLTGTNVVLDRGSLSSWAYEQRGDKNLEYLAQVCVACKDDLLILIMVDDEEACFSRDKGVAKRGWTVDDLIYQQMRMMAAASCLDRRGVKVRILVFDREKPFEKQVDDYVAYVSELLVDED